MTDTINVAEVYGEAWRLVPELCPDRIDRCTIDVTQPGWIPKPVYDRAACLGRCVAWLVESGYRLILYADEPEDGMTICSLWYGLAHGCLAGILTCVMDQIEFPTIHHAAAAAVEAAAKEKA